jgi:hypothetical protein
MMGTSRLNVSFEFVRWKGLDLLLVNEMVMVSVLSTLGVEGVVVVVVMG